MSMFIEISDEGTHSLLMPIGELLNGALDLPLLQKRFHCI
jgi:hypothetical protein